jgi:hypothetical protein
MKSLLDLQGRLFVPEPQALVQPAEFFDCKSVRRKAWPAALILLLFARLAQGFPFVLGHFDARDLPIPVLEATLFPASALPLSDRNEMKKAVWMDIHLTKI